MYTRVQSAELLKNIFKENFFNNQDVVTKNSPHSILDGWGDGVGEIGLRALKEVAVQEGYLFPEVGVGAQLDAIAARMGIPARSGATASKVYVRIVATPGTIYISGTIVNSSNGVSFEIDTTSTIPSDGFLFFSCTCTSTGARTNVPPFSIVNVVSPPAGHIYCINEYVATGGSDSEDDDTFRRRIQSSYNTASSSTSEKIKQVAHSVVPTVLDVVFQGYNDNRKKIFAVVTVNGAALNNTQLSDIADAIESVMAAGDSRPFGTGQRLFVLENAQYLPVDISLRCSFSDTNIAENIAQMQQNVAEYFDFSQWVPGATIQWAQLYDLCSDSQGVDYAPDKFFFPGADIATAKNVYPRVRSFSVLNLSGNLYQAASSNLKPVYYPFVVDQNLVNLIG